MFEKQSGAGEDDPRAGVPRLPERTASARAVRDLLADAHELLWQVGDGGLTELMDTLGALEARAGVLRVAVAAEAEGRGVVEQSTAANTAQWVRAHSTRVEPGEATRVARLAGAIRDPRNEVVTEALLAGTVSPRCADVALKEAEKVAPLVPTASRGEVLGWFLDVAQSGGRKEMDRLSTWVIGRFGGDQLEHDAEKARRMSGITVSALPGGLKRYVMDLAPEHTAIVDAAMDQLSAPQSSTDPATGENIPDPRQAPQRRAEALVELVQRAQGVDPTKSVTGTTKLVVTVSLADLVGARPDGARPVGARPDGTPTSGPGGGGGCAGGGTGRTQSGDLLDIGTLRRMACDADLIPMVLGAESEPLDVGREQRLFTGGLRTAVVQRDRKCTFPGCDRPPGWTRVHHVTHWIDGGKTCLLNAALLCERHHVIVHRDNLTATVTTTGVTWHL
ncbi:MAG TPA: DUF222 domain-containing protein [Segeticoccus sp.]|uniref:HNH endonuclease signature motif containing protein n=1 Tax=Segeticoccus sp. TaxID=2706531 RepID=UPI002D7F8C02|nr:DUF222 domain-containing protein [Segeticoccus sp.]HET8601217.1 DUF222 domain-containing protein [Segeticoccus sp.]